MKEDRQALIREIISRENIETQDQLLERLQARGITCTQATISRDIKQMNLTKVMVSAGVYKYADSSQYALSDGEPEALNLEDKFRTILRESVASIDSAQNIVVIRTMSGLASGACTALDNMHISSLVGSLAGDDTVLLVMRDMDAAEEFCLEIRTFLQ